MTDYASRIAALDAEQVRFARRKAQLAAQRREEIGKLAERQGVLEVEDDVLSGVFLELKAAITGSGPRLAQWREAGRRFRSGKSNRQRGATVVQGPDGAYPRRDA